MKTLEELRAALKSLIEGLDAIEKAAQADDATEEQVSAFDKALDDIDALKAEIKRAERAQKARADAAQPAGAGLDHNSGQKAAAVVKELGDDVLKTGLVIMAKASVHRGAYKTIEDALETNGYGQIVAEIGEKSLMAGNAASGGFLVPDTMSSEIIEFLRPQTAFLRGNPRRIPMPNGSFTQPGGATGASTGYGEELANASVTEQTFREINMTAKELKTLIPVSNQFLDFSLSSARQFVEQDLRDSASETMDAKMFRGMGTNGEPLGLFNIPGIGSAAATDSTTPTMANIDSDLRKAINGLVARTNPVNLAGAAWVISRRILGYMEDMRDGNGNFAYPTLQGDNKTLKGIPVLDTTNIPENLGAGSNEGFISLVAFPHVLFGEAGGTDVAVSDSASYTRGGVTYSAFQRGETLMKITQRHDVGLRHVHAVFVLTAVKWGAA